MTSTGFPNLPSWFNLNDYKPASNLDAKGWLEQLTSRHSVLQSYDSLSHIESTTKDEMVLKTMLRIPHSQAESHLDNLKYKGIFPEMGEDSNSGISRNLINPFTFRDNQELKQLTEENIDPTIQDSLLDVPLHEHLNLPECIVYVDIFANREKVLAEFTEWLDSERDKIGMEGKYTNSDFKCWTNFCVLPYLDLKIWCRLNNVTIPDNQMGKILFPDESEVGLATRVTETKEMADKLMTWDTMNILSSMCA
jgi:hypothetical protein